ncbi:MAG: SDR family NAD(P)-dependent oxidoreductase, partial [Novipirellula sp. JB048]
MTPSNPSAAMQQTFACEHPVALITGSGSPRVGRTIATWLAALGCRIALHANTSVEQAASVADEIERRFHRETIVTCGALEQDGVADRLVDETLAHFGRIDVLVNSAAIWQPIRL